MLRAKIYTIVKSFICINATIETEIRSYPDEQQFCEKYVLFALQKSEGKVYFMFFVWIWSICTQTHIYKPNLKSQKTKFFFGWCIFDVVKGFETKTTATTPKTKQNKEKEPSDWFC